MARLRLADTMASRGEIDDAEGTYRELIDEAPEMVDAHAHLGIVLGAIGRNEEARDALETALALAPWATAVRLNLAQILVILGANGDAAAHYRALLEDQSENIEALTGLAGALLGDGESKAALRTLWTAHRLAPDDASVNAKLGEIYLGNEDFDAAIAHFETAERVSEAPAFTNNLATALLHKGDWIAARRKAEAVLEKHPDYAIGWHTLGLALIEGGRLVAAGEAFRRALALEPGLRAARYGLAQSLRQQDAFEEALEIYQSMFAEAPDPAALKIEMATVLERLGRYEEAIVLVREALPVTPDATPGWNLLALCLISAGRIGDSLDACERALALDPASPTAHVLMIRCHWERKDFETALRLASEALGYVWDDVQALKAIATMTEGMRRSATAAKIYRRILELEPKDIGASSRLFDIALSVCDWRDYDRFLESLKERIRADLESDRPLTVDVFNLQALPLPYALIGEAAHNRARSIARETASFADHRPFVHPSPMATRDKIRLGYTHMHSLPLVMKELVAAHDRERFEVFGYSVEPCDRTEFSIAYRAAFDHFTDVPVSSPYTAANRIRDDDLDLLFDVTGLTSQNCMPLMSFRPAPIQVHGFGYSITTGADYIDYLVTDPVYVPPEWARLGPEAPIYLPDTFMPTVRPKVGEMAVDRAQYGLPESGFVFGNFNHPCKFEPRIFSVWMRILAAVPDSVLWFGNWLPETRANLEREAEARGISAERLLFSKIVPHEAHCARLPLADLALDNLYHGGGITTVDALWVGLPVLTIRGDAPAARLGATLSRASGVEDLVVDDLEHYERLAIELAADSARLHALRRRLLAIRDGSALFDADRFRRHFEHGLEMAVVRARAGLPPATIEVPAID